jgi:hypothetical protein
VTIINICSLAGVVVLPFMKKAFYIKLLIFMVALAVGSLAGSGLLVLIPEVNYTLTARRRGCARRGVVQGKGFSRKKLYRKELYRERDYSERGCPERSCPHC